MCGWRCGGLVLMLLLVMGTAGAASAGRLAPSLERELALMETGEFISVMAVMADRVDLEAMDATLKAEQATRQERHERVVTALQQKAEATQGEFLRYLELRKREGSVEGYTPYWIANLVVVRAKKEIVTQIAGRPDIEEVYLNFGAELIKPVCDERYPAAHDGIGVTEGLRAINADDVWYELGITGEGRIVANLDTGVDGNHPALATRWRGYQGQNPWWECWMDALGGGTQFPTDNYGHGTHVIGTMTGRADATGDTIGVAHHAQWIANNAINQGTGPEFDNDVVEAYQWFADPDGNPQTIDDVPDVVQNSWRINEGFSSTPPYTDCDDRWWEVLDGAEAAGVVVTFSAGNEGPSAHTIGSPPDRATTEFNCFSVGAVDATNYPPPYPIANWSSRGPTGCPVSPPLDIKPEVCAPGVDVYSSVPGGGYEQWGWSGTSMAGPHAAGIVGLMREANPDIDVDDIKNIIMETTIDYGTPGNDNTYGYGFVDAYAAVVMASVGYGTIEGHIYAADNLDPLPALVVVVGTTRQATADPTGYYDFYVPGDSTYTLEASYFGFETQQQSVYLPPEGLVTLDFYLQRMPTGAVSGLVTDVAGDPIEDAVLEILDTPIEPTSTNVNGLYQFADVPGGADYQVSISAFGYSSRTKSVHVEAGVTNILSFQLIGCFMDNMEQGAAGWTHEVLTPSYGDQWHLSTQRNYTPGGAVSWKCGDEGPGDYADSLDAGLVTPEIDLPGAPLLTFWHWMDAEKSSLYPDSAYDGGLVEIDAGLGWTQITPEGGYPHAIRSGSNNPLPPGTPVWSGTFDWTQAVFDLSAYGGMTVQFRFRFTSDWAVAKEGWYVDDVAICRERTVTVSLVADEAYVPQGGQLGLTVTLVNNTNEQQNFFGLCDVFLPNGHPFAGNPIAGPRSVQLAPQGTISVHLTHPIPGSAPCGLYTYRTRIGNPPNDLIDVDAMGFMVTPAE